VRFQADGWQEPYESRGSRRDLRGTGGEIPPVYPAHRFVHFCDYIIVSEVEIILDSGWSTNRFLSKLPITASVDSISC